MRVIGPTVEPPKNPCWHKYKRGLDPWHRDAFPDALKDGAPYQTKSRFEGWLIMEGNENVGFIRDGTQYDDAGNWVASVPDAA